MSEHGSKSTLTQEQLLRQRLLPQQLRFAAMLEETTDEIADEIELELAENPALEKVETHDQERRYYSPRAAAPTDDERQQIRQYDQTLGEHLNEQLVEQPDITPAQHAIVEYMIGALDSNGYLTRTLPQIRADIGLASGREPQMEQIREAAATLRSLEPAGVGAQDLRDCLLLQLKRMPADKPFVSEALEIVRHWFDLFAKRNFKRLGDETGLSEEQIRGANALIATLNPKPGSEFSTDPARTVAESAVIPDFIVETDGETLTVSMPNSLPALQLEESFRADTPATDSAADFIRERRTEALTFIDLLRRRADALMKIAQAIVNLQAPFFLNGDDETLLRPMVLRQVAEKSGIDLTAVSRAISGKWLATEWGVYPLKSFFTHRGNGDNAEMSTPAILAAMRDIIDSETPSSPLSDEAIAAALDARGLKVARRTVAKYRDRMNILPARLRKH